ncbi:N-formylglutamate amidohydrolase [Fulvivirga sp. RKSG066]|uniref:N-formylglutamate amidohydrolase n=1 Tax=Fulvivirga aurantia TaxID=2529383 RepID=UPI0012BCFFCF|nr:N-formylglutamate amidohydrolase [Fulvivirga aurantia]MTI20637.1 N-formylglutamate amidohydrolase [Fulvivirga aurantia]
MGKRAIIITCEHAGNYVPKEFALLFLGHEEVLESHRGWDPGAMQLAKAMAKNFSTKLHYCKVTRLLVEVNRSIGHEQLFSEFTKKVDPHVKQLLLDKYYKPYRQEVQDKIEELVSDGHQVIHISMHTFTPVLNGIERTVDIGILFDDNRREELVFSDAWKEQLQLTLPDLTIMHNCPYHGADDGFTTYLRTKFTASQYLGLEIEVNQKLIDTPIYKEIGKALSFTLPEGQVCN